MQLGQLTANEPHDTPPGGAPSACGHGPPMGFRDQQEVLRGRASYAPECAPSTMTISTALSRPCRALDVVREGSAAAAGFNAGSAGQPQGRACAVASPIYPLPVPVREKTSAGCPTALGRHTRLGSGTPG